MAHLVQHLHDLQRHVQWLDLALGLVVVQTLMHVVDLVHEADRVTEAEWRLIVGSRLGERIVEVLLLTANVDRDLGRLTARWWRQSRG